MVYAENGVFGFFRGWHWRTARMVRLPHMFSICGIHLSSDVHIHICIVNIYTYIYCILLLHKPWNFTQRYKLCVYECIYIHIYVYLHIYIYIRSRECCCPLLVCSVCLLMCVFSLLRAILCCEHCKFMPIFLCLFGLHMGAI